MEYLHLSMSCIAERHTLQFLSRLMEYLYLSKNCICRRHSFQYLLRLMEYLHLSKNCNNKRHPLQFQSRLMEFLHLSMNCSPKRHTFQLYHCWYSNHLHNICNKNHLLLQILLLTSLIQREYQKCDILLRHNLPSHV